MPQQPVIYYAITLERGENWDTNRSMREQEKWDEHARFMDALVENGFIVLGGPLDDEEKALLILNAENEQATMLDSPMIRGYQWECGASQKLSAGKFSWMLATNEPPPCCKAC